MEVLLETTQGEKLQISTKNEGNAYIADIPNAQLRLSTGDTFSSPKPVEGIAEVTAINIDANTIRVTVRGETGLPTVELFDSDQGLIFAFTKVAVSAQQPETQQQPEENPPTSKPPSDQPSAPTDQPIELVVTGEQDGYNATNVTTATKTDTPLRDIPQSIQVVPRQVIEDQKSTNLTDALRNVSGITEGNTFGGSRDAFNIRGFEQRNIFRNGFRGNTNSIIRDTANLERIEVLKGPASVIFGTLEPGGVVNLVTKAPLAEPLYSAELEAGSFGLVRPSIDLTGPFNSEKNLLYRFNAAYENSDGFRNFDQGINRLFTSPVVSWKISDRTDLTLDLQYLDDTRPFDRGIVAIGRRVANIPHDRVLGQPDDIHTSKEFSTSYQLEHRFSENLTLRSAFQFSNTDEAVITAAPRGLDETTGELSRVWTDNRVNTKSYSLQTNLIGKFSTGSIKHTLLVGVDLNRETQDNANFEDFAPSINIFNLDYSFSRPRRDELGDKFFDNYKTDILGVYLQDQITLADNVKLLLGGRYDIVNQRNFGNEIINGVEDCNFDNRQQVDAFTPRIGIVYQPIKPLSLYGSFSQSFAPNSGTTSSGSLLEPQRGTQYEVGIRGEFFDSKLSTNLAAYYLTKSNIPTLDPDNDNFSIAIGEQRTQGIELDITGEILPGLNVIASYAYTDAKVTKDNTLTEGNKLFCTPRNAASLWTTYQIQRGNLQGLGLGLGLFFVGDRQGDLDNSFEVSSYVRTDASVFYRRDNWRAGINIKNLLDTDYIESTNGVKNRVIPGLPFTVLGTISVEF